MLVTQTVSILALAATALAAPQHGRWGKGYGGKGRGQQQNVAPQNVNIVYVDQNGNRLDNYVPPKPKTIVYVDQNGNRLDGYVPPKAKPVVHITTKTYAAQPVQTHPPKVEQPEPEPEPQPAPEPQTPNYGDNNGYISIVNSWRGKLASPLGPLTTDSTLEANALRAANEWSARGHQLFSGSRAQVMAPGNPNNFESAFVGAWLCERHDLFANGECSQWEGGWDHSSGDTGHADILTGNLKKIGCANGSGTWICDLA